MRRPLSIVLVLLLVLRGLLGDAMAMGSLPNTGDHMTTAVAAAQTAPAAAPAPAAAASTTGFQISVFAGLSSVQNVGGLAGGSVLFGYLIRLGIIFLAVYLVHKAQWVSLPALGTGLVVTRGTQDVYIIGRGNRRHHYDLAWVKPKPFVKRRDAHEVDERVGADGSVLQPLDGAVVDVHLRHLDRGVEVVTVDRDFLRGSGRNISEAFAVHLGVAPGTSGELGSDGRPVRLGWGMAPWIGSLRWVANEHGLVEDDIVFVRRCSPSKLDFTFVRNADLNGASPEAELRARVGAAGSSQPVARCLALVKRIIGVPDYEAYVRHMAAHHPGDPVLTEDQFAEERLTAKYSRPGQRCC